MKSFALTILTITLSGSLLHAVPVADGAYVDLIVVPVGAVALAEFEADTRPVPTEEAAQAKKENAPPSGGGSGIRVKQQDPADLAPSSVFVKASSNKYYQIPCSLNAVNSPVRTPITDTEVTLYQRTGDDASTFRELAKVTLAKSGGRYVILLSKPLKEKSWQKPTISAFPFPAKDKPQLYFVNGSQELQCGVKVGTAVKALPPLTPLAWENSSSPSATDVDVSLAMRTPQGQFLQPFYQSNVELKARRTAVYISYGVTGAESFRGGKFATGNIDDGVFRPASPYNVDQ